MGAIPGTITHEVLAVDGGDLPLTVARAGAGQGVALVIATSAFGVAPDLEAQMSELALHAEVVASFDPFFREDPGVVPYTDMPRVMARLRALDRPRALADFRALIRWARGGEGRRTVVALGICFGGPFALHAAADGLVDGVVTWHGSRMEEHLARAAEVRCPLRFHFGEVDPVTPPGAVEAVRVAFEGAPDVRLVVHAGATHGFSHRTATAYDAAAERAGMDAVRELAALLRGKAG